MGQIKTVSVSVDTSTELIGNTWIYC
ncbi:hypothetical protein BCD_0852 (plasmid) [Borrelia crocidurae DOU]|uniref:Uncharacterized protein n=1 Tax=Borrelia crocidurae DOU TaxID=1293575 RepID=W5SJV0_9SPIR|nr:hypothetical protein BCD_0852 [Borrelia crocidurae DOU]